MRKILDCRTLEVASLTEKQRERIDNTFDKLNIPKDATVQVNLGMDDVRKDSNAFRSI